MEVPLNVVNATRLFVAMLLLSLTYESPAQLHTKNFTTTDFRDSVRTTRSGTAETPRVRAPPRACTYTNSKWMLI